MNLDTETRNGYTILSSMKKVWSVQMELLGKLLDVCEKHQLRIWAEGGTLLGAVREHGYIPWDDDIDMAMMREDYDKLISISQEEFQKPYYFQSGYSEENYPRGHAQLRKDNTAAINQYDISQSFHQGIFIDIFVYDEIPDDEYDLQVFFNQIKKSYGKLKQYCEYKFSIFHPIISIKKYLDNLPIKKKGFHKAFEEFDNLLKSQEGNRISCVGFSLDVNHYGRDKLWYSDTLLMPFEDIMMPVPSGYDMILKTQYGDYMRPVKAPTNHGVFLVLDTAVSYEKYMPQLRKEAKQKRRNDRLKKIEKVLMGRKSHKCSLK
ncbi:MAG: LicD family protein [Prevotella sp.]|nr:LicD family protein [Prevotella sp.]